MTSYRLFAEWAVLFLVSSLLVVFSLENGWTQRLDAVVLDLATEWRAGPADDSIVLVEIDDRSLAEVGHWPWDRSLHAELVQALEAHNPKVIALDVLFLEPNSASGDVSLAEAIEASGNVLLAHTFANKIGTTSEVAVALPLDQFRSAAAGRGHVAILPDQDGVLRRFDPVIAVEGQSWPHFVKASAETFAGRELISADLGAPPISTMRPASSFRKISAADVIAGRTPTEFLAGKLVIVGATAQGLGDRFSVPDYAGRLMSGSEIQANFIHASLNYELVRSAKLRSVGFLLIIAIAVVFVALWKLPPRWALRVNVAMAVILPAASAIAVISAGIWVPIAPALLGIILAYPLWGWRRLTAVSRFLESEAEGLIGWTQSKSNQSTDGFDTIAQQVKQVKLLIGNAKDRLAFFRQVISASPDPILVFDGSGTLSLMNARAEKLFGELDQTRGLALRDLIVEQHAKLDRENNEITMANGSVYLVAESEAGFDDNIGILALRDISELRENELQRSEMLEFLSHDMRSPQVAIIGLAKATGGKVEEADRFKRIEDQARRTLKLTEDFVQISRLDYEGIKLEETDIAALLHEALDRAYPLAKRKQIEFECSLPEEPEFCDVDPFALSRAVDNLLGNAVKFSPDRSAVILRLNRESPNSISIVVSDSGPGLPKERVKETFARFGAHDGRAGPSAGLGLAFVKRVVDEHGGTIEVHTNAQAGTKFVLNLPCQRKISGELT